MFDAESYSWGKYLNNILVSKIDRVELGLYENFQF